MAHIKFCTCRRLYKQIHNTKNCHSSCFCKGSPWRTLSPSNTRKKLNPFASVDQKRTRCMKYHKNDSMNLNSSAPSRLKMYYFHSHSTALAKNGLISQGRGHKYYDSWKLWEKEDDFNQCLNWAVPEPFTLFEIFTLRKYLAKKPQATWACLLPLSYFTKLACIQESPQIGQGKQSITAKFFSTALRRVLIGICCNLQVGSEHYAVIYDGNALRRKRPAFMMWAKLTNFRVSGRF